MPGTLNSLTSDSIKDISECTIWIGARKVLERSLGPLCTNYRVRFQWQVNPVTVDDSSPLCLILLDRLLNCPFVFLI